MPCLVCEKDKCKESENSIYVCQDCIRNKMFLDGMSLKEASAWFSDEITKEYREIKKKRSKSPF